MKIALRDSTFNTKSFTLAGENATRGPASFEWDRKSNGDIDLTVFTDMRLQEVTTCKSLTKLAILIEPLALTATHYQKAEELEDKFNAIFTYEQEYIRRGAPYVFYPFGGSWIKDWGIFGGKTKLASIIVSDKHITEGHKLRHKIAECRAVLPSLDIYGEPYTKRFEPKWLALRPYMYSIIIENVQSNWWFTEKLIDCISQGTIPIYWGCPQIGRFFDRTGMIPFYGGMLELEWLFNGRLGTEHYAKHKGVLGKNLLTARSYPCAEDWIFSNHREYFLG